MSPEHDPDAPPDTVPPSAANVVWDEQPTVNLTGDDLASLAPSSAPEETEVIEHARELSRSHLAGLLEALIFASDKPIKDRELARLASAPVKQVRELLVELKEQHSKGGVLLDEVAGGWLFRTSAQYAPFVREMSAERPVRLSRAQLETLAIVAYRQPITRPEIDEIRGVDSGATLKLLADRELMRILGKRDEPGRPLLYGTTTAFLELFGLRSLKDLPSLKEFAELSDESRRVAEAELGEPVDAPPPRDTNPLSDRTVESTIAPPESGGEHDTLPPPPPAESEPLIQEPSDDEAEPPAPATDEPEGTK